MKPIWTKVVVACASFKGTLSSAQAGRAIAKGLAPFARRVDVVPLADGGEGLVDAIAYALPDAKRVAVPCHGPSMEKRTARIALLDGGRKGASRSAVIEMAASSGLTLVPEGNRDPRTATTFGVGDQIRAALDRGVRCIYLGLGGSATNDGGAGMVQALGARLLDAEGRPLPPGGAALASLASIDVSEMDPRLKKVRVMVACDVNNLLCGRRGASKIFGPQKGATAADVKVLDAALGRFARIIKRDLGKDVRKVPGAGAAGGLGGGCLAFLNAELKPGIEWVLDILSFDHRLKGADLVVTGEGRLDRQTLMGKAPAGVAARARAARIYCVAVGGSIETASRAALRKVFADIVELTEVAGSREAAMADGARWLRKLAKGRAEKWAALAGRSAGPK